MSTASRKRAQEAAWSNPRTPQSVKAALEIDQELDDSWKDFFEQKRQQRRAVQAMTYRRTF